MVFDLVKQKFTVSRAINEANVSFPDVPIKGVLWMLAIN
jgi:hypothetical protein